MNALHNYLNGRSSKSREKKPYEELSLPRIPQNPHHSSPKTSIQHRAKKRKEKQQKYSSETTLSPDQEHLHDQIKIALGGYTEFYEHQAERPVLPRLEGHPHQNQLMCKYRKSRSSASQKMSLDKILGDPHSFMENYFNQINKGSK